MLYSAPQLRLLILLALTLLAGLGVREWRAGFPTAAERFERFDREEPAAALLPESPASAPAPAGPAVAPAPPPPGSSGIAPAPAAAPPPPPEPVDVNRADVAQLARLPGVGAGLAQRIVEERQRRGRFDSPEALRQVMGVGPKKLATLRDLVTVGE